MLTAADAQARAARGAAHLDRVKPGWFRRIDLATLTLHDECRCIVGQLCRGQFVLHGVGLPNTVDAGVTHGFVLATSLSDDQAVVWRPLQDAWVAAIAARIVAAQGNDEAQAVALGSTEMVGT